VGPHGLGGNSWATLRMNCGTRLAKLIIEAHDGSIAANSPGPGEGSTFQIRLPLSRAD